MFWTQKSLNKQNKIQIKQTKMKVSKTIIYALSQHNINSITMKTSSCMPRKFSLLKGLTISRLSWAWKKGFDGACQINHASSKEIRNKHQYRNK